MEQGLVQLEVAQATRTGNRSVNQDRVDALETSAGILLVLGDGLGGRARGELAAQTLIDVARDVFHRCSIPPTDPQRLLTDIVRIAHFAILDMSEGWPSKPGTTGVMCLVRDGLAYWLHVGDSRLYLLRDGRVLFRTRDHSYVEHLYRQGAIRRADMERHPARHQLTQCIGCTERQPEVTLAKPEVLRPGDVVLLCSDGFWSGLKEADVAEAVRQGNLGTRLDELARSAEQNSAPHSDNVSVVALRYLAGQPKPKPVRLAEQARKQGDGRLAAAVEDIESILRQYMDEMDGENR